MVYLSDYQEDNSIVVEPVSYLPKYDPSNSVPNQDLTFKLTAKEAKNLINEKGLLHNGCIKDSKGRKYYPESNPFTFGGKSAMLTVSGWFTGGIAATIKWDSKRHVLEKQKMMVSVKVNNESIKKHPQTR